jgi:hypothetical protein
VQQKLVNEFMRMRHKRQLYENIYQESNASLAGGNASYSSSFLEARKIRLQEKGFLDMSYLYNSLLISH